MLKVALPLPYDVMKLQSPASCGHVDVVAPSRVRKYHAPDLHSGLRSEETSRLLHSPKNTRPIPRPRGHSPGVYIPHTIHATDALDRSWHRMQLHVRRMRTNPSTIYRTDESAYSLSHVASNRREFVTEGKRAFCHLRRRLRMPNP